MAFIIADLPADAVAESRRRASRPRRCRAAQRRGRSTTDCAGAGLPRQCGSTWRQRARCWPTRSCPIPGVETMEWRARWLLVVGSGMTREKLLRRCAATVAAARFGAKIVARRNAVFEDYRGSPPTHRNSGVTLIQRQMPVFTQQALAYDVLVAAVTRAKCSVFHICLTVFLDLAAGRRLGGTRCQPVGTRRRISEGAIQMQNRFMKLTSRAHDGAGHAALDHDARMIGEANITHQLRRCKNQCPLSCKGRTFPVAAFKGQSADAAGLEPSAAPAHSMVVDGLLWWFRSRHRRVFCIRSRISIPSEPTGRKPNANCQ